jgi:bacteriocin biosynthesis cyclodehydratase domain-containing protein
MVRLPALKPHLRQVSVEGDGVFIFNEFGSKLYSGQLYEKVIHLVDGIKTTDEIIDELSKSFSASEVYFVLIDLFQDSIIFDAHEYVFSAHDSFWSALGVDLNTVQNHLSLSKVKIICLEGTSPIFLKSSLNSWGISVVEDTEFDLGVVLTTDYLSSELKELNLSQLQAKRPWLLLKPIGVEPWIGPLFIPEETGCWACLEKRLASHRIVETFVNRKNAFINLGSHNTLSTPFSNATTSSFAAMEIAKWFVGKAHSQLVGTIVSINNIELKIEHHYLTKNLQCSACVKTIRKQDEKDLIIMLKKNDVSSWNESGYRTIDPQETISRYERHISRITGLISELAPVRTLDKTARVYVAGHNFALRFNSIKALSNSLRSKSSGKGKTEMQAKASALCEALERYSMIFQGNESTLYTSYDTLQSKAIHPNKCMLFSDAQLESREFWNEKDSHFNRVPEPFDDNLSLHWSPVWSMTKNEMLYLPTSYLYFPSSSNCIANHKAIISDSNGAAAGNTIEEAILQGFFELVERDSVAIWWYNRLERPSVDLNSLDDRWIDNLIEYYENLHREIWVLDLTMDFNIPTFGAISRKKIGETEDIIFGFGAHFDAKIAIQRALGELNQMLPFALRELKESINGDFESEIMNWFHSATIANQPYLIASKKVASKHINTYSSMNYTDNIANGVLKCKTLVEEKGLEMLVLNLTRSEIGLNVVKVIIPGIRHFWARLAKGRLYDVPVELGWVKVKLKESELNPIPFFL